MERGYYCTTKQCQKEIDYQLKLFPTKELFILEVKAVIFDLSETPEYEKSNPNQLKFWRKVLTMLKKYIML
jgi:hypothetical protein